MEINELETYLENVLEIIFDVQVCIYNAEFIGSETSPDENWVKGHTFFKHYFHQLRFVSVIQLCKVFSPKESQAHNFEKLLNRLETTSLPLLTPEYYRSNPTAEFWIDDRQKLNSLISKIRDSLNEHRKEIIDITELRDTIYAHRDKKVRGEYIPWPKLKGLSDLALEIHNNIKLGFFGSTFMFPNKESWSPKWVVRQASKSRPKRKSKD